MDRRELFGSLASTLKGEKKKQELYIRPPYFNDESLFQSECHKCAAKCATVCEEDIIKIANDKTPYLIFNGGGCTFCDECANICELDVLNVENKKNIKTKITIDKSSCLSWQGVMCFSCKDPCLDDAIDFKAMFMPSINDKCTSCGFCISRCPSNSILIKEIL